MKEYFKYIKTKPGKLSWMLFVTIFCVSVCTYLVTGRDEIEVVNSSLFLGIVIPLIAGLECLCLYQPYREWKDGL